MLRSFHSNPNARGFAALYASTFLSGTWAMIIPTIPVLGREFGVSAGGAAQIVTAAAIGRFFGTILAGIVLDRMGTRVALVGAPLVACLASLLCAVAPWFALLLLLSLCIGAADSLWAIAREIAAIDLVSATAAPDTAESKIPVRAGDLGEVLDARARSEYRERLRALEEDIAEAEARNDRERAARLREERDLVVSQLSAAYGIRGRGRRGGDPAERARQAVAWRIRDAIARIAAAHPDLGRHLKRSIRSGRFCSYEPESPTLWGL